MEHAQLSRRVWWMCASAVEVAPNWSLGMPPDPDVYFLLPHYIRLFLSAGQSVWMYFMLQHKNLPDISSKELLYKNICLMFEWLRILNLHNIEWDNFQIRNIVRRPEEISTRLTEMIFYTGKYKRLVDELYASM